MIVFKNKGLIDETAISTFGVSVKESDNPIGYFGTGLKYAIAILLRHNCSFNIFRGNERLEFKSEERIIRGKQFNLVTMNGKDLGFTTDLGKNWEPWQAFRELYCNTADEGGDVFNSVDFPTANDNETTIVVQGKAIEDAYKARHEIILSSAPAYKLDGVEVHMGKSEYVYYRGIRAAKLKHPAEYTYNITAFQVLTEDRTLAYPWMVEKKIAEAVVKSTWEPFLEDVLTTNDKTFEGTLPFSDCKEEKPSPQFMAMAQLLKKSGKIKGSAKSLFMHYEDTIAGYTSPYIVELTAVEADVVRQAREIVQRHIDISEFSIIAKSKTNERTMRAFASNNQIFIPHSAILQGAEYVAEILIEAAADGTKVPIVEQLCHLIVHGQFKKYVEPDEDSDIPF